MQPLALSSQPCLAWRFILISRYANGVHLDADAVLLGELAFAPFDRMVIFGTSVPKSLAVMSGILLLNAGFITLFYKRIETGNIRCRSSSNVGTLSGVGALWANGCCLDNGRWCV